MKTFESDPTRVRIYLPSLCCPFEHAETPPGLAISGAFTLFYYDEMNTFLVHLWQYHGIAIAEVDAVFLFLEEYVSHYAASTPMLSGVTLGNDLAVRQSLHEKKLSQVTKTIISERFERSAWHCPFCPAVPSFSAPTTFHTRDEIIAHLAEIHKFHLGQPDNLVFVAGLFHVLKLRMASLQCLFCDQMFRDLACLKRHMRRKNHYRLNPRNPDYDRFFASNYLEYSKKWYDYAALDLEELALDGDQDSDEEFSFEVDEEVDLASACLFCDHVDKDPHDTIHEHMPKNHGFNLPELATLNKYDFHDLVKLVNYIRRKYYESTCHICERSFDAEGLEIHYQVTGHCSQLPEPHLDFWKDPQYLLPTYDDDYLFLALDFEDF